MKISDETRNVLEDLLESMIQELDMDIELVKDCFPLKPPYRKQANEALLTIETRMKHKLRSDPSHTGIDIIDDAKGLGVFNRSVPAEAQGIELLFRGSVMGIRNVLGHNKPDMSKEEAIKIILFVDYLIKLFDEQCKLNRI